jgi:predicted HD superfamily hydrolase involved in NAD metabolism
MGEYLMQYNIEKIKQNLKRKLNSDRYEHTISVAYIAIALAMRYDYDIKKAEIAGLLHDCAKCIPDDTKLSKCMKYNISISDIERENPYLLHAKLGAFLAMNKYRVDDKDIVSAILYHTTGRPSMSTLEKIIYIADYIEPNRTKAFNLSEVRRIAFVDLDLTMYLILRDTVEYLKKNPKNIDVMTIKAYEYYDFLQKEKSNFLKNEEED